MIAKLIINRVSRGEKVEVAQTETPEAKTENTDEGVVESTEGLTADDGAQDASQAQG